MSNEEFIIRLVVLATGLISLLAGLALKLRVRDSEVTPIVLIAIGFACIIGGSDGAQ